MFDLFNLFYLLNLLEISL